MNQKEARRIGRANGEEAAHNCEVETEDKREAGCPCSLDDPNKICGECLTRAAFEAEQNARQYAGHLPEFDNDTDEARYEGLWEAYEEGVGVGVRVGVKNRLKARAEKEVIHGGSEAR